MAIRTRLAFERVNESINFSIYNGFRRNGKQLRLLSRTTPILGCCRLPVGVRQPRMQVDVVVVVKR